jgi:hypothetical protein
MRLTWKPLAAGAAAIILLIGIIAAVAGSSGAKSANGGTGSNGEPATASVGGPPPPAAPAVLDTWKAAGLTVSQFAPVDGSALGGTCQGGTVGGIDVTLCTYPSADAAKKAEDKGYAAVGATTGTALAQGSMLLVAADRKKADPQGRTINQLAKLFRGGKT